jgi:signal transduction histidine kinase
MDRFPVLYLLNLALISICIINYHLSVLKLQETAEELRQSKEEADRANRGKSDFLSSMSHEIRTPINAVLGMNEMILRESLSASGHPPKDKEESKKIFSEICNYSGNIESAGNNLLYIINDILDFSKIESGKCRFQKQIIS